MMIESDATVFPILLSMALRVRNNPLPLCRDQRIARPWFWLIGCFIIPVANQAWGQTIDSPATLSIPAPDQQPASPWSKPFRVSIPKGQPPRHEMTQHDSLDEPIVGNRMSGVAPSDEALSQQSLSTQQTPRSRTASERPVRASLASQISEEVLTPSLVSSSRAVQPIETPPGWASVETTLRSSLDRCDHLLRRGAVHSSRQEAVGAIRQLLRALDLHKRSWESEPAFQQGLVALKESEDFERSQITELTSVHRLVQSHQTTILQETSLDSISPAIAAQHYRAFARDAFLTAADGHPWGADLFYALGKTYEKESQQQPDRQLTLLQHGLVCFQTAYAIDPRRSHIANQLGFNLLQLDKVNDAMVALNAAIAIQPSANAYRNLAEAYRRTGQQAEMQLALQQATALAAQETRFSPDRPEIAEISPEEFARISPPSTAYELYQTPSKVSSRSMFPSNTR
jgi:tetratricopeptide (TPR) repeat protein